MYVMGLIQRCTIVGVLNFKVYILRFSLIPFGFWTTVTRCIAMYVLICHAKLWHHLKGLGDMGVSCDVMEQGVYTELCNDAQGSFQASFWGFWPIFLGVVRHVWAPDILLKLLHLMASVKAICVLVIFGSSTLLCSWCRIHCAVHWHSSVSHQYTLIWAAMLVPGLKSHQRLRTCPESITLAHNK